MSSTECATCEEMRVELGRASGRILELETAQELLRAQLREALKLNELQHADLDRYRAECARLTPNRPERVPSNDLQLAFERVVATFGDPANDAREPGVGASPAAADEANTASGEASSSTPATASEGESAATTASGEAPTPATPTPEKKKPGKRRHQHGRRRLDLTNLPVEIVPIEPDEVKATGGEGFIRIGEEVSNRLAFRPASYMRLRLVRGKWVRVEDVEAIALAATEEGVEEGANTAAEATSPVLVAPLPDGVWPNVMADPSAITQVILSKYDDVLPLNRQERISLRQGLGLPRSTLCGWLKAAYGICFRIVDAMFKEGLEKAFCLATDATGAPVRAYRACDNWHVFVFIADRDHVVFRYTCEHTRDTVATLVGGFRGYLLSDAAPVYDVLHRGGEIIEVACWFHCPEHFFIRSCVRAAAYSRGSARVGLGITPS